MSFVAKGLGLSLLVLATSLYACGDNKPPPAAPETPPASEGDGGADMPGTADGADGGTAAAEPAPPPAPKLDLPAESAKLKVKLKGKATEIEIKSDGTVNTAGKPTHKVTGMELQDKDGKGLLKADVDGNITNGEGAAYAKFDGDDLAGLDGSKFTVADEGVSQIDAKGKKTALGTAEGIGSAKKASALVVAYSVWGAKPPAAPKPKK
ncbi:MAG: hypothetical protein KIT84_40715 [Labilithrix sp.]|nr:hypothetical protein [Labilithrix sp.]MCW5817392.1 hypothetical protein [Labilithrix sp.]